jgi:LAO/AO transport system kinase
MTDRPETPIQSLDTLVAESLGGKAWAVERLVERFIAQDEERGRSFFAMMKMLHLRAGGARVFGLAGVSDCSKTSIASRLVSELEKKGSRVAWIDLDSSPFLGDAEGVLSLRPFSRVKGAVLSHRVREVVTLLDACGFNVIFLATEGWGRAERDVLEQAQTVVLTAPSRVASVDSSDQSSFWSGLIDLAVIAAEDSPDEDRFELRSRVSEEGGQSEEPRLMPHLEASIPGELLGELLLQGVERHQEWLRTSGVGEEKERRLLQDVLLGILIERLGASLKGVFETSSGREVLGQVLRRELDPYGAADLLSGV